MKQQWILIENRVNSMNKRERLLILLCVLTFIYLAWDLVVFQSLVKKRVILNNQLSAAEQQIKTVLEQESVFSKLLTKDPDTNKKKELLVLKKSLQELDKELQKLSVGLIAADKLPEVLHDVLSSKGRLKLISMKTLPVEKLHLSTNPDEDQSYAGDNVSPREGGVGIYRYSVSVILTGKYFDVVDYLKSLENLDWRFYWESIEYKVEAYPQARVTLEVYTLSTEEGLISA